MFYTAITHYIRTKMKKLTEELIENLIVSKYRNQSYQRCSFFMSLFTSILICSYTICYCVIALCFFILNFPFEFLNFLTNLKWRNSEYPKLDVFLLLFLSIYLCIIFIIACLLLIPSSIILLPLDYIWYLFTTRSIIFV